MVWCGVWVWMFVRVLVTQRERESVCVCVYVCVCGGGMRKREIYLGFNFVFHSKDDLTTGEVGGVGVGGGGGAEPLVKPFLLTIQAIKKYASSVH